MNQQSQHDSGFIKVVKWICMVLIGISSVTLAIMLFVSVADVIGRVAFFHPIQGTFELVGLLMVVIGCLGMGYCQLVKGNVAIDILLNRLNKRGQTILNILSFLMSIAVCIIISSQLLSRTFDYMSVGLKGLTITLKIPLWPFMLLMAISFAWVAIIFVIDLYNSFREVLKR
jgi:TRAP-type C4-dicarboxylate transport system permease small subunit